MSEAHSRQVFQSLSPKRWKSFLWAFRILLILIFIGVTVLVIDLYVVPHVLDKNSIYKKVLNPEDPLTIRNKHNQAYKLERKGLPTASGFSCSNCSSFGGINDVHQILARSVRAGYYVNWKEESYPSLERNIDKLNMIIPEWLFVDELGNIVVDIDENAHELMKKKNVAIVPMLSNFWNGRFGIGNIDMMLESHASRRAFIKEIIGIIKEYDFKGVNLNFFNISEKSYKNFQEFQKELYFALHHRGLLVSQNIEPYTNTDDLIVPADNNDLLFLMAYGQHKPTSADNFEKEKWLDNTLDQISRIIPTNKIVLTLPTHGFDHIEGEEVKQIKYKDAIDKAREHKASINFDYNHYNLQFSYIDKEKRKHKVFFTDAAATFHAIRLSEDRALKGVAMFRLGDEDDRVWNYYNKNLNHMSLSFNEADFNVIEIKVDDSDMSQFHFTPVKDSTKKLIVLTFDDGPDERYTPKILDILRREKVPASFFVTGVKVENNIPLLRKIHDLGYEIGNHTFTHPNLLEVSRRRAAIEVRATTRLIECITGRSTKLFRPPYSADEYMFEGIDIVKVSYGKEDYYRIGDPINPKDWQKGISADSIYARTIAEAAKGNFILLHDGGGDRSATVEALPRIIRTLKAKGYTFTTVAEVLGRDKEFVMPVLTSDRDLYLSYGNNIMAHTIYYGQRVLFLTFFFGIILAIGRMVFIAVVASVQRIRQKHVKLRAIDPGNAPLVSIVVPAYNEEINAIGTVRKLLEQDYPNFEILFIDDGSKDRTYELVSDAFKNEQRVSVFTKTNGGKASALNFGIDRSNGVFLVCIDADTQLKKDAVTQLVSSFTSDDIGAVAGNVKVGNEISILTRWQSIEYITAQNFDKRAFDLLNCITVVPGAIGVFRKSVVLEAGKYTTDTLAEDCDLTMRILRNGHRVVYNSKAIAMTEAPESLKQFLKQRFRWTFGIFQAWWKHKDTLFNYKYKALGLVAMPNTLIFSLILPLMIPLADIVMVSALISGNTDKILSYYFAFLGVEVLSAMIAFSFERENVLKLWLLMPQRLIYRWFMWYVLIKALFKAIKGELMSWGILKRTGNVKMAGN